jgi:hypothetical protein
VGQVVQTDLGHQALLASRRRGACTRASALSKMNSLWVGMNTRIGVSTCTRAPRQVQGHAPVLVAHMQEGFRAADLGHSTSTASSRSSSLLGTRAGGRGGCRNELAVRQAAGRRAGKCTAPARLTSLPTMRPGIRLIGGSENSSAASTLAAVDTPRWCGRSGSPGLRAAWWWCRPGPAPRWARWWHRRRWLRSANSSRISWRSPRAACSRG